MTIRPKTTLHEVTGEEVECWVADGLEDALLGYGEQGMHTVAVYDYDKCIEIFMTRDGCTQEEAVDHMSYNVTGTSFESKTPVFVEMHWTKPMKPIKAPWRICMDWTGRLVSCRICWNR